MVQEGLCVVVPCSIFYPSRGWSPTTPAYGFWFRDQTPKPSLPVATNKPDQDVDTNTQGRFQLLGDPSESCSLLIKEAHLEDSALYFFRFERGDYVKYNFMEYKFYLEVTGIELARAGMGRGEGGPLPHLLILGRGVKNRPCVTPPQGTPQSGAGIPPSLGPSQP